MSVWLRRILVLGLISLGIALIFFPFNDTRSGKIESEIVSLQEIHLLDPEAIGRQYPGHEVIDITGPQFHPDDYPDLWRVFRNLDEDWTTESGSLEEWNRLQASALQSRSESDLVVFMQALVLCTIGPDPKDGEDKPKVLNDSPENKQRNRRVEITILPPKDYYESILKID